MCLVSGTNGKTTTTALVAAALGDDVTTNQRRRQPARPVGSARCSTPTGDRAGPVVLEVDESYLPAALDAAPDAVAVLLNLSRDQLDRHSETRMLALRWRDALAAHPDVRVVANVDDPLVVWAASAAADVTWVAGGAEWHSDAAACPACGALLARTRDLVVVPRVRARATGADDRAPRIARCASPASSYPYVLALPGRANRGNLAMAVGAARALGVSTDARARRDRRACARSPAATRAIASTTTT